MANDLLTNLRRELDERLGALRPVVREYERLLAAAQALGEPGTPPSLFARSERPAAQRAQDDRAGEFKELDAGVGDENLDASGDSEDPEAFEEADVSPEGDEVEEPEASADVEEPDAEEPEAEELDGEEPDGGDLGTVGGSGEGREERYPAASGEPDRHSEPEADPEPDPVADRTEPFAREETPEPPASAETSSGPRGGYFEEHFDDDPEPPRLTASERRARDRETRVAAREAILAALEHGSHTVSELVVVSALPSSAINQGARGLLREGAIVKVERDGDGKAAYALARSEAA